jgi:hypothetical protein
MVNELNALENKVGLAVSLCNALRAENAQLRLQLTVVEGDKKKLAERMESARERLEQLAQQLPQAKSALAKQA